VAAGATVIVAMLILLSAMFLQYRTVDEMESSTVPWEEGVERLSLRVVAERGEVEVSFAPLDGAAVNVTTQVRGTAGLFGGEPTMSSNVSYVSGPSGQLNVSAMIGIYAPQPFYSLEDIKCRVVIDTNLPADINITVTTGGAMVRTANGTTLNGLSIDATTLGSVVALNNGTVLAGNVHIRTATGGSQLYWNNISVSGYRQLQMEESSGDLIAKIYQTDPMGGSVVMTGKKAAGLIELHLHMRGGVSAMVEGGSSFGQVELATQEGFSGDDKRLVSSHNHPAASMFDVRLNNTIGSVEAWCSWSA